MTPPRAGAGYWCAAILVGVPATAALFGLLAFVLGCLAVPLPIAAAIALPTAAAAVLGLAVAIARAVNAEADRASS